MDCKRLEAERRRRLEKRQKILTQYPEVYRQDFDKEFKNWLACNREGLEKFFGDNLDDPALAPKLRQAFVSQWSREQLKLCRKYHLARVWDPYGEKLPQPASENPVRPLHRQEERVWLEQIDPEEGTISILPYATEGRFLLIEVDLHKPLRELEAGFKALVNEERMQIEVSKINHKTFRWESVPPVEPRDRGATCIYPEMEVFDLVNRELQHDSSKRVSTILSELAKEEAKKKGIDESDFNFDDVCKKAYKALKNAYERDNRLYFGE